MRPSTGNILRYHKKGTLQPFGVESYYNSNTAANILAFHSLTKLKDAFMLYDSRQGDCFRLIYKSGKELQFQTAEMDYTHSLIQYTINYITKRNILSKRL